MSFPRADDSSTVVDGGETCPQTGRGLLDAAAIVVSVLAVECAIVLGAESERSVAVQTFCLLAAMLWVGVVALEARRRDQAARLRPREWLAGFAVIALACLLRSRMLSYLPLPDRTGFEELQMGADGYKVLTTWFLPLEFRFSKIGAAVGLAWGGATVEALRLPFQIMGYLRLPVLYLCLRGLGVSRWPSAFVTITAAVSRWFLIGSSVAYEDFSPTLVLLLLLLFLIKVDLQRASAAAWAASAGVMAGVLLYENSSFRFAVLLGAGWLLWLALAGEGGGAGPARTRWRPLALFVLTLVLVATPMLVDVAERGRNSIFFEAVARYARGRSTALAPLAAQNLRTSLEVLAGRPVELGSLLARPLDRAMHPLTGVLFVLAALGGLVRPWKPFVRALVLAALAATVVCSVTTNDFQVTRLAPVASIMLVAVGGFLQSLQNAAAHVAARLPSFVKAPEGLADGGGRAGIAPAVTGALIYGGLSLFIVQASAARAGRMAADRGTWREYANDQYVTARYLARVARPESRVLVVTPEQERLWSPESIAYWVYAAKRLQVQGVEEFPRREAIERGTLVVIGAEGRALRVDEIERLKALAKETGSLATMDLYHGRGDRILAASACIECAGSGPPGSTR